jgi:hypothetical protein
VGWWSAQRVEPGSVIEVLGIRVYRVPNRYRVALVIEGGDSRGMFSAGMCLGLEELGEVVVATHGLAVHLLRRHVDPVDLEHELVAMELSWPIGWPINCWKASTSTSSIGRLATWLLLLVLGRGTLPPQYVNVF